MLNQIDLSQVDLNLLVLFDVVLAERHVGRAAARLHVSPSAISHGLGRLRVLLSDPLFLKHPKGVVPTARALSLGEPVAEVLAGARRVLAGAESFAPGSSKRRFVIGAPDAVCSVLLGPLLSQLQRTAPAIDLGFRDVLPPWENTFSELDTRGIDVAILPQVEIPARFVTRTLFQEEFAIAMRKGHPLGRAPSLSRYCAADHVLVSRNADAFGHVDQALAKHGLTRRVVLTLPSFMLALSAIAGSDIVGALPRSVIRSHEKRLGLATGKLPLTLRKDSLRAIVPRVALADAGLAWLLDQLENAAAIALPNR
jgi:DNA-binding transcriptional LysR family regulator